MREALEKITVAGERTAIGQSGECVRDPRVHRMLRLANVRSRRVFRCIRTDGGEQQQMAAARTADNSHWLRRRAETRRVRLDEADPGHDVGHGNGVADRRLTEIQRHDHHAARREGTIEMRVGGAIEVRPCAPMDVDERRPRPGDARRAVDAGEQARVGGTAVGDVFLRHLVGGCGVETGHARRNVSTQAANACMNLPRKLHILSTSTPESSNSFVTPPR